MTLHMQRLTVGFIMRRSAQCTPWTTRTSSSSTLGACSASATLLEPYRASDISTQSVTCQIGSTAWLAAAPDTNLDCLNGTLLGLRQIS